MSVPQGIWPLGDTDGATCHLCTRQRGSGVVKCTATPREGQTDYLLSHTLTPVHLQKNSVCGFLKVFLLSMMERIVQLLGQP